MDAERLQLPWTVEGVRSRGPEKGEVVDALEGPGVRRERRSGGGAQVVDALEGPGVRRERRSGGAQGPGGPRASVAPSGDATDRGTRARRGESIGHAASPIVTLPPHHDMDVG